MKKRVTNKNEPIISRVVAYSTVAANMVTALAGTGAFCLYLWTVHVNYIKERDPQFSGNWTTFAEGCVGCPLDKNDFITKLNIEVTDGTVTGEIYIDDPFGEDGGKEISKKTKKELFGDIAKSYTNWFLIDGELTFYGGKIRMYDYRGGVKTYFGESKIKLNGGTLYLETTKRAYDTIPLEAVFSLAIEEDKISEAEVSKRPVNTK